jgi:hypothetical protein
MGRKGDHDLHPQFYNKKYLDGCVANKKMVASSEMMHTNIATTKREKAESKTYNNKILLRENELKNYIKKVYREDLNSHVLTNLIKNVEP